MPFTKTLKERVCDQFIRVYKEIYTARCENWEDDILHWCGRGDRWECKEEETNNIKQMQFNSESFQS